MPLTGANFPCCRGSFRADGFFGRSEPFQLVTHADQKHRLFGILEQVDDAPGTILQVDRFAVGEQVQLRVPAQDPAQAVSAFAFEEARDAPDPLEGKSLAEKLADHDHFEDLGGTVRPVVAFAAGADDLALVPPLQLAQAHPGNPRDLAGGEGPVGEQIRTGLLCFEHKALFLF